MAKNKHRDQRERRSPHALRVNEVGVPADQPRPRVATDQAIEPEGSRTGNPFGDRGFLGAATAVAYKTESWGGCGRHLSPGMSSKVATDGPFEAVLGKTHRTEFSRGKGKPEARSSPPGAPSLLGSWGNPGEIRAG